MTPSITDAGWRFDNSYTRLPKHLFARESPTPVCGPSLVLLNRPVAEDLGLDPDVLGSAAGPAFAGNELPPGADPIAQAYAGHQFGHFTNLGDGRAILLGEQLTPDNRRFDIQLKGSGRTRYSRGGDGRAALGPMLREYIISEGMHALGIPTTRSLAVAATGEQVLRATPLPGAVLTRVAASHVRVGSFEFAAAVDLGGNPHANRDLLAALLEHVIVRHASEASAVDDPAVAFVETVVERQASLLARWMLVGFVHGVMNTDNMAVSGETIDYGPCAFLDVYDPATVFSSIDRQGRYAFGRQSAIAHWNLARLAESLLPLVQGSAETGLAAVQTVLGTFPERYERHYLAGARAKLGLTTAEEGDGPLFAMVLEWMRETRADFTSTFAGLAALADPDAAAESVGADPTFLEWCTRWRSRLARQPGPATETAARMRRTNPVVIPRNHRVEEALAAAESGEMGAFHRLLAAVRSPFIETADNEPYRSGPPEGCGPYRTFCGT